MAELASESWTLADYLAHEAAHVGQKPNYEWDGRRPVMMSGASFDHHIIDSNLFDITSPQFRKRGCRIGNDLRVRVDEAQFRYRYPDLVAHCKPADLTDERPPSLRNPILLIEILSPSTSSVDMREKLVEYRGISSLLEYWIVSTDAPYLLRYEFSGPAVIVYPYRGLNITFTSEPLGVTVALADVFADLDFESED